MLSRILEGFTSRAHVVNHYDSYVTTSLRYLKRNKRWVSRELGVPESDWMVVTEQGSFGADKIAWAIHCKFVGDAAYNPKTMTMSARMALKAIEQISIRSTKDFTSLSRLCRESTKSGEAVFKASRDYSQGMVSLHCGPKTLPVIYVSDLGNYESECKEWAFLVLRRSDLPDFLKWGESLAGSDTRYSSLFTLTDVSITTEIVKQAGYKQLVLDENIVRLVCNDMRSFYERKPWFTKHNIPHRRGYLFHGPPGNGKTSTIRAAINEMKMDAYTIDFFNPKMTDARLRDLFKSAANASPAMVVLEDIDRAFPKTGERVTNFSMQTLLNCMDGLSTQDGVITIATANDPTILDAAILKRPGRFDRAVLFSNPDAALRQRYFQGKLPDVPASDLEPVITATDGMSFAQLQETFVLASGCVFDDGRESILSSDLLEGASLLKNGISKVTTKSTATGFKS